MTEKPKSVRSTGLYMNVTQVAATMTSSLVAPSASLTFVEVAPPVPASECCWRHCWPVGPDTWPAFVRTSSAIVVSCVHRFRFRRKSVRRVRHRYWRTGGCRQSSEWRDWSLVWVPDSDRMRHRVEIGLRRPWWIFSAILGACFRSIRRDRSGRLRQMRL